MTEKKSTSASINLAIRWVVAVTGLILLIAKGFGAGVSWLTILGVLAIPGALGVAGLALAIPLLVILGVGTLITNSSK